MMFKYFRIYVHSKEDDMPSVLIVESLFQISRFKGCPEDSTELCISNTMQLLDSISQNFHIFKIDYTFIPEEDVFEEGLTQLN